MPRWFEAKRVVVYGIANASRDHRDYATIGEWVFDLVDHARFRKVEAPLKIRRTKKGRYSKAGRRVETRKQYRDPITGRFTRAPTFVKEMGIPDDDTIVADVLGVVEEETGQPLFRTPSQRAANLNRVDIGIQKIGPSDLPRTYSYDEFLKELRRRVRNEWGGR